LPLPIEQLSTSWQWFCVGFLEDGSHRFT
jgi:hypothetical protein